MRVFGREGQLHMFSFQLHYWQTCSVASGTLLRSDFTSMVVSDVMKAEGCNNSSKLEGKLLLFLHSYLH